MMGVGSFVSPMKDWFARRGVEDVTAYRVENARTGLFLEPSPGPQPVANIFNMARAGLEVGLLAALRHAAAESNEVIHTGVQVRGEGDVTLVDLRVRPVATRESSLASFTRWASPPDSVVAGCPSRT